MGFCADACYLAEALFQHASDSWHWPYSINAILSFVATLGLAVYYHPPTYQQLHDDPNAEHLKSKDWKGLIVLTLALGSLTYFLLWGSAIFGKSSLVNCCSHQTSLTKTRSLGYTTDDYIGHGIGLSIGVLPPLP